MRSARTEDAPRLAGRYRAIRQIGTGGMATVTLAEDERLGRFVAVKRLPTSSPEDALARFRREARIGASLNHPNVVSIFDSTTDGDSLLIVMEYVEGESLKERLRGGPLPLPEAVEVLSQIAAALDHAHRAGVIHRDVKPSNVLIGRDGITKLADLGIATAVDATRITTTNDIIGTLSYIAPERLEKAEDDPSADIYSLAAVAFEAISGQRAQRGTTPTEIVTAGGPPDLREAWPQAPAAAAEALAEGLSRDPHRRPASAGELIDRLSSALSGAAVDPDATTPLAAAAASGAAPPPADARPASKRSGGWSRRRTAAAAALAGVIGAVIAIVALGSGGDEDPQRPKVRTQTQTQTVTQEAEPPPAPSGFENGVALDAQGYDLIQAGQYEQAIGVLQEALDAFERAGSTGEIEYAYALFNLGHALRLAGRPEEAIPILEDRLEYPDQRGVVSQELALAQQEAGVGSSGGVSPDEGYEDEPLSGEEKPGNGPKPGKGPESFD